MAETPPNLIVAAVDLSGLLRPVALVAQSRDRALQLSNVVFYRNEDESRNAQLSHPHLRLGVVTPLSIPLLAYVGRLTLVLSIMGPAALVGKELEQFSLSGSDTPTLTRMAPPPSEHAARKAPLVRKEEGRCR